MNPKDDKTARTRRQYSAEEKVRLLKLHLVDGQPILSWPPMFGH
jgi:transposase-like protein